MIKVPEKNLLQDFNLLNLQACNLQLYKIRGVSRMPTTSKIKFFKTLVNGLKPLTNDTKSFHFRRYRVPRYAADNVLHHRYLSKIISTCELKIFLGQLFTLAVLPLWQKPTNSNCKGVYFQYGFRPTASNFRK